MNIHAIQTGLLWGNRTTFRAAGWSSYFRRRVDFEFPVFVYIIEHPEGYIAIDTGVSTQGWSLPLPIRRVAPMPIIEGEQQEIGPQMKSQGIEPGDIRTVILTHLDVDHVGGLKWFPNAEVWVQRKEYEFSATFLGKMRSKPELRPEGFNPKLYDLDPKPFGPFPESKTLTEGGDVILVPLPGHTPGQIGVIVQKKEIAYFFSADHVLSQEWFVEDWAAGQLYGLGALSFPDLAVETAKRIHRFTEQMPTVLLPAHDEDAPRRLAERETVKFPPNHASSNSTSN